MAKRCSNSKVFEVGRHSIIALVAVIALNKVLLQKNNQELAVLTIKKGKVRKLQVNIPQFLSEMSTTG